MYSCLTAMVQVHYLNECAICWQNVNENVKSTYCDVKTYVVAQTFQQFSLCARRDHENQTDRWRTIPVVKQRKAVWLT